MKKNQSFVKNVLFTSLPYFLIIEVFFAFLYFILIQFHGILYSFFGFFGNLDFETNFGIFSPFHITIFLVFFLIISFLTFLEIISIIAITTYDFFRDDKIGTKTLFSFMWKKTKKIFSYKNIGFFLIIIFFPKEHISGNSNFSLKIPPFIIDSILENSFHFSIFSIIFIFSIYFVHKSIFVAHIIFFENKTFLASLKESFSFTKKIGFLKMMKIFFLSIFYFFIFSLPILFLLFLIGKIFGFLFPVLGTSIFLFQSGIYWLQNFLMISLAGVFFLAYLTGTYIKEKPFLEKDFYKKFDFLQEEKIERKNIFTNFKNIFKSKKSYIFVFIFTIFSIILSIFFVDIKEYKMKEIEVIAHRGYLQSSEKKYFENTIEAIKNAHKAGATRVEIDIYENADGSLVLFHDLNLSRLTGKNIQISELTDKQTREIKLLNGSKIPFLYEVFELAKKEKINLLVEPKLHHKEKNLYGSLVDLIKKYEIHDLVTVHSLSLFTVLDIKNLDEKIKVGYTVFGGIGNIDFIPVDFFSIQETIFSRKLATNLALQGKKSYVWTVNNSDYLEKYIHFGADGFITDEVEFLKEKIKEIRKKEEEKPSLEINFFGKRIIFNNY